MTELAKDVAAIDVTDLLTRYSFDLAGLTLDRLVDSWLNHYPTQWVRLAVIEALYQGRYKAISVEQILNLWERRGRTLYRFNHEFERVVCGRFPHIHYIPSPSQFAPSARSYSKPPPQSPAKPTDLQQPQVKISSPAPSPLQVEPNPIADPETAPSSDLTTESPALAAPEVAEDSAPRVPSLPKSSPVAAFQPHDGYELEPLVALSTARSTAHHQPIHQFVPSSESSDFYAKLRAVAQGVAAVDADRR